MTRLKDWLTENYIYFNSITAALLAVMAIIVSAQSCRQYARQTEIQQAQAQPIFVVQSDLGYDNAAQVYSDASLTITNRGAAVRSCWDELNSFLEVKITVAAKPIITRRFWVTGYFGGHFQTGDATGRISSYRGFKNNLLMAGIDHNVMEAAHGKGEFASVRIVHIVKVAYTNILGEKGESYFLVDATFSGTPISKKEADEWNAVTANTLPLELSRLSANDLISEK